MPNVDLIEWIEPKYKNYSVYVNTQRSIPHLIDGFKPSQRKIIYTAQMKARSLIKTVALSGFTISLANYHHGDKSLSDATSKMAQDFTGSNNYPLLDKKGGFGNKFGASISSPRYTYVKIADTFEAFYNIEDYKVLPKSPDIENPEPEFYVPIIPYVLLNGISGMGVGFATNIPSYDPLAIINNIKNIINGKKEIVEIKPFYKGYSGKIVKENNDWFMYGNINVVNTTTLNVTEVPVGISTEKFKTLLNKLIEDGIIKDYDDLSDSNWNFVIRAHRKLVSSDLNELYNLFKLKVKISENINVVFDEKIKQYGADTYTLIKDFVKIRLEYYDKRKQSMLNGYVDSMLDLFIKLLINGYISSNSVKDFNKDEVLEYINIRCENIHKYLSDMLDGYNTIIEKEVLDVHIKKVLSNLRMNEIYSDKIIEIKKNIKIITDKYNKLFNTSINNMYKDDLKNVIKIFKK